MSTLDAVLFLILCVLAFGGCHLLALGIVKINEAFDRPLTDEEQRIADMHDRSEGR